jgi:hypothetical protein
MSNIEQLLLWLYFTMNILQYNERPFILIRIKLLESCKEIF